jgi:polyphosphate kinase 2 (PPK2 family)
MTQLHFRLEGKDENEKEESQKPNENLKELQEKPYAEHKKKILVVLQAMDTEGKDGVIHRVFQGVNPQGVRSLWSTYSGRKRS